MIFDSWYFSCYHNAKVAIKSAFKVSELLTEQREALELEKKQL